MGTDRIPAGPTPGDLELNEDDMRNAQSYAEQDEKARTGDAYGAPAGEAPGESSYTPNATGASTPVRSTSRRMPPVFGAEKTQSGAPAGVAADGVPPPAYDAPSMGDPPTATYDAPPGPPPMHDAPAAGGYGAESAQEEKERLKRQYETADAAAGTELCDIMV